MEVGKLHVEHRNETGKGAARRLRARGLIPGICYGKGKETLPIALNPRALAKSLDPEKRHNTVISMTVDGSAQRELLVMLKDYQIDALRNDVQHADFVTVDMHTEVHVTVPLVLTGKAAGVKEGGTLHAVFREIPVACVPTAIPSKIEVDVSKLGIGDSLHVRDLSMPKGVRALIDPGAAIASVVVPKVEKAVEEVAAEAAPVEGAAAPAAGAAGAAPAAGAAGAKPAAGAAPAKAGGKEEKKGK